MTYSKFTSNVDAVVHMDVHYTDQVMSHLCMKIKVADELIAM